MKESWRNIPGYDGKYQADMNGLADTLFASCLEIMKLEECTNTDNCGVCKRCALEWLQSEAE